MKFVIYGDLQSDSCTDRQVRFQYDRSLHHTPIFQSKIKAFKFSNIIFDIYLKIIVSFKVFKNRPLCKLNTGVYIYKFLTEMGQK